MAAAFAAGIAVFRLGTESSGSVLRAVTWCTAGMGLLFLCVRYTCRQAGSGDEAARRQMAGKARRALALILAGLLAGMLRASVSFGTVSRFEGQSGARAEVSGVILRAEEKEEGTVSAVLLLYPENRAAGSGARDNGGSRGRGRAGRQERILLTIEQCRERAYELPGRTAALSGTVKEPASASNPGTFDYALYLRSRKILFTMKTDRDQIEWTGERNGIWRVFRLIGKWKAEYGQILERRMGEEEASALRGILFGEDQYMDGDVRESFGENGIGHLLAASGLHTGFVYALLFALCGRPRTITGHLPVLGVLAVYAALADFSPSVMRAFLMIVVSVIGRIRFLRTDFLTNIAFCAGILMLFEPAVLFSSGFQLSFTAVLSLAVVLPAAERLAEAAGRKWDGEEAGAEAQENVPEDDGDETEEDGLLPEMCRRLWTALTAMAALQAGMVPVTLKHFHYISIAGLVLNMPAIALAGWIVPAGVILMPVSLLRERGFAAFADPLLAGAFQLTEVPLRLLLRMNGRVAAGGHSCIYAPSPPSAVLLLYYALLLVLCTESGNRFLKDCFARNRKMIVSAAAAAALFSCGFGGLADGVSREADLVYVDVGQGNCAHMRTGKADILFDSGGSEFRDVGKDILMPYFLGNGVGDIELAVLSHLHTDHYKGLCTLKDYVPVRNLALSEAYRTVAGQIEKETGVPQDRMLFLKQGDRFAFGGAEFTVLAPKHRSDDEFAMMLQNEEENSISLVVRAEYKGVTALFTGDISSELETELVASCREDLHSDILTVAHHGSRFSTCDQFLDAAAPEWCVIQVGANNIYGHPSPETLERIAAEGSRICRNDLQGAVLFRFSPGIRINVMKDSKYGQAY